MGSGVSSRERTVRDSAGSRRRLPERPYLNVCHLGRPGKQERVNDYRSDVLRLQEILILESFSVVKSWIASCIAVAVLPG